MPGALIERPQMTRTMYGALKRHIVRDRQKKKQEQEQDEALERQRKEREQRKKKEQEDSLNLEETKEQHVIQISQLTRKMESLKNEKHELFSQLKKVLHQEDETKKKAQLKEHNEMMSLAQQYPAGMIPGHPMFMQGAMPNRTKYLSLHQPGMPTPQQQQQQQQQQQGIKRQRSPSPPAAPSYPAYSGQASKFPPSSYHSTVKQETYSTPPKQQAYAAQVSTHVTYASQAGHTYQQTQPQQTYPGGPGSAKYAAGQSAFTSYPSHYPQHQKGITDHPAYPQGYTVQRVPQSGYMAPLHSGSSLPLQQQLEQANQKSGFSEEKYKLQQQQLAAAGLPPGQQAPVMTSQIAMSQHQAASSVVPAAAKGSIVTGYPVRSQAVSTAYQSAASVQVRTPSIYSSSQVPRHPYAQQPGRNFY